jgi:branched-chain amino acid aminotransferase
MDIKVTLTKNPKEKPAGGEALGFGKLFSDHMFLMDYQDGKGWHDPRIVPYGPLSLDPATTCLHYGQLIFEGMKAYKTPDGKIVMFRPKDNMERLNRGGARICLPPVDADFCVKALAKLVGLEAGWVPDAPGTSLYIRPFMLGLDPFLGVKPSDNYLFCVILSPSGAYYQEGLAPVGIYAEDKYVRAVRGGTGFAKVAGNYAASMPAQKEAQKEGFSQVLWLDGLERKYVDEVGAMNIFFVIDGKVATPTLGDTVLAGITRDSIIKLLKSWDVPVEERRIDIQEIADAHDNGKLEEIFGSGTAAVVSPVGELCWKNKLMKVNDGKIGALSQKLYDNLTGIQTCRLDDPFGWVYHI